MAKTKQPEKSIRYNEYPENITEDGTYISFTFYDNTSSEEHIVKSVYESFVNTVFNASATDAEKKSYIKSQQNDETCGTTKIQKKTKTSELATEIFVPKINPIHNIKLYFPIAQEIINTIGLEWREADGGIMGAIINQMKKNPNKNLTDLAMQKKDLIAGIGFKKVVKATMGSLGESAGNALDMLQGFRGINPMTDSDFLQFMGLNRRSPSFNFRFMAKNEKEQNEIDKILHVFQLYSYPDDRSPAGILYPMSVRVDVYIADRLLIAYDLMQIQSLSVNNNPEGFQFLFDGTPAIIDLTIELQEAERYYKKSYERDRNRRVTENDYL